MEGGEIMWLTRREQWHEERTSEKARYIRKLRVSAFARGRRYKQGESQSGEVVVVVVV